MKYIIKIWDTYTYESDKNLEEVREYCKANIVECNSKNWLDGSIEVGKELNNEL